MIFIMRGLSIDVRNNYKEIFEAPIFGNIQNLCGIRGLMQDKRKRMRRKPLLIQASSENSRARGRWFSPNTKLNPQRVSADSHTLFVLATCVTHINESKHSVLYGDFTGGDHWTANDCDSPQ